MSDSRFIAFEKNDEGLSFFSCSVECIGELSGKFWERNIFDERGLGKLAISLAIAHNEFFGRKKGIRLYKQVKGYRKGLGQVYEILSRKEEEGYAIASGSEWIIDNFYLLEEHTAIALRYLADHLDRSLPKLLSGPYADFPRIYHLALELVSHTDALLDSDLINHFVKSYQSEKPLAMRELWGFPVLLRIELIRKIHHLGCVNQIFLQQRIAAEEFVKKLFDEIPPIKDPLISLINEIKNNKNLSKTGCQVHLIQALRSRGIKASVCLQWINNRLLSLDCHYDKIIRIAQKIHAANQVSIANCFESLQIIAGKDWKHWFEEFSHTHQVLLKDPSKVYKHCDFQTRNRYCRQIERISDSIGMKEVEVAEATITLAKKGIKGSIQAHVGYYLIDDGKSLLDQLLYTKPSVSRQIRSLLQYYRNFGVWSTVQILMTLLTLSLPISILKTLDASSLLCIFSGIIFFPLANEVISDMSLNTSFDPLFR